MKLYKHFKVKIRGNSLNCTPLFSYDFGKPKNFLGKTQHVEQEMSRVKKNRFLAKLGGSILHAVLWDFFVFILHKVLPVTTILKLFLPKKQVRVSVQIFGEIRGGRFWTTNSSDFFPFFSFWWSSQHWEITFFHQKREKWTLIQRVKSKLMKKNEIK